MTLPAGAAGVPLLYCDFEYNDARVLLFCGLDTADGSRTAIDLRAPEGVAELRRYAEARPDHLWVSYSAHAEIDSFLRAGIDVRGMAWACLMVEASMLTMTLEAWKLHRPSLLAHCRVFDIPLPPDAKGRKEAMRARALADRAFASREWAEFVEYCWSDIDPLPELLETVATLHAATRSPWRLDHAIQRGEYLKASAILARRTRGLPIDVEWMRGIYANRAAIRNALAERCNAHYGCELYRRVLTTARKEEDGARVCDVSYAFSHAGLETYLSTTPFFEGWEKTPSGLRRTDEEYLDELCKEHDDLKEFARCRAMLAQLKSDALLERLTPDGFMKAESRSFYTVTGRNQPLVSRGFVLNAPPWFRSVIRPKPGWVLIGADWSKQEIGVACALSGDAKLTAAFESDDLYFELAKMAGAAPRSASAKDPEHAAARQAYKSVQLGLGFGMGRKGLAKRLFSDLNAGLAENCMDRAAAMDKATEIFHWHKLTFSRYWSYLEGRAERARNVGWTSTGDDWLYFAGKHTSKTKLLNFPMQGGGAEMLRRAVIALAYETDLDMPCSLHDALYVYAREEEAEAAAARLTSIMQRAVRETIGDRVKITTDVKTWTHDRPYRDGRGAETLAMVEKLIADIEGGRGPAMQERLAPKPRAPKRAQQHAAAVPA